jgi:hypothetical protein
MVRPERRVVLAGDRPGRRCRPDLSLEVVKVALNDGVGEGADLGSQGIEINPPVVGSRSNGGWPGEKNASGNPPKVEW